MNSFRRMLTINIIILIVLVAGGFAGTYFYNQRTNYLSTDNAQINGQLITIAATTNGKLASWDAAQGSTYKKGDTLGTIVGAPAAGSKTPTTTRVTMPQNATIVQNSAVPNTFVAAGTPLAQAYDMTSLWVTANIKETNINDVKVGQTVDIYVDAYPNTSLTGTVKKIGLATSSTFSLLPSSNNNANYTKVTQVIPVRVSIDGYKGLNIVPGMNVTVRIHK